MRFLKIVVLIVLAISFACTKKKYPEESVLLNEPVFYFKANVNNVPYSISAGIEQYRMYSTYTYNTDSVYTFNAELKLNGCLITCPYSLKIQFNDSKKSLPGDASNINLTLKPSTYSLTAPMQEVEFFSAFNKGAQSYKWDFGDGTYSTNPNPKHVFTRRGIYNVCLTISDYYGCKSTICNSVRVGYFNKTAFNNISVKNKSGKTVSFYPVVNGGRAPYKYLWNFGDGTSLSTTQDTAHHTYPYNGSYPVSLRVIDAASDTTYSNYNVVTQQDISSCAANYSLVTTKDVQNQIAGALSGITVSWTDATGLVYTSGPLNQPYGSYFEIISVDNYEVNENNELTKKIKLKFNCNVYNGTKVIPITNAEAVLCVSYK